MSSELPTLPLLLGQLRRVALIARMRSDLSVQELIEIGDALLAAPVFLVEVAVDSAEGLAVIAEFRRRYGDHLVVGAAAVTTLAQLRAAMSAGAHFFAMPTLDPKLLRFARQHQLLCLPHVTAPVEARLAYLEGCPVVSSAIGDLYPLPAEPWPTDVTLIASGVEDDVSVAVCRRAGAGGVRLQTALFPTPTWSHAEIITTARHLRRSWEGKMARPEPK